MVGLEDQMGLVSRQALALNDLDRDERQRRVGFWPPKVIYLFLRTECGMPRPQA